MTRMRPPTTALVLALASLGLLVACGNDTTTPPDTQPDTLAPVVTEAPVTETTAAGLPIPSTEAPPTSPPPTTAPAPTLPPTTVDDTLPHGPDPEDPGAPGPGSSGCRTTAGTTVTVSLTDPMPGPDFCLEIRQSQQLEVVNNTAFILTLSIYQGSAENLFETPPLGSGEVFTSEPVGQVFPTGEWLLEVSDVPGWLGTLWVVTG